MTSLKFQDPLLFKVDLIPSFYSLQKEKSQIPHKKDIDIWGYLPESFTLMKKIKSEFDPVNIMNIGRFIGGI